MQYLGGKKRLAKRIAAILDAERSDGQPFVDVFCGSLAISAAMPDRGPHIANDACVPLINMYKAWREGWRPPEHVSEELYAELKAKQDPVDPLTAFAGFGLSWGGKWFGGYARSWQRGALTYSVPRTHPEAVPRNFARDASKGLERDVTAKRTYLHSDFALLTVTANSLVYCDPPYRGTTKYSYFKKFDHDLFEDTAQRWADEGATVFVSERTKHRESWDLAKGWPYHLDIARGKSMVEQLFRVRPV